MMWISVFVYVWIAIISNSSVSRTYAACLKCTQVPPQSDIDSLLALYKSTRGSTWRHGWAISNNNPCAGWYGVTCCSMGNICRVADLSLTENNLVGSIPPEMDGLTALQTLVLSLNDLRGLIPVTIGNLTALTQIDFHHNGLTGPIPASIGHLKALQYLYFYSNYLTGSIPPSIGNLTSLTELELHLNRLTGSIPASIGHLKALQYLNFYNNYLTGSIPPSIGNITALIDLELYLNRLTGSIPASIGHLKALNYLYLNTNDLTGSIPLSIGNLTALTDLEMFSNRLTGSIPASIGCLTMLQYLYLDTNDLTGSIPPSIGNLTALNDLELYLNRLTGSIPASIGRLIMLQYLVLVSNDLTGSIPPSIGNLTLLAQLQLSYNHLVGSIPSSVGCLVLLQNLNVYSNDLTGSIPPSIGNLTALNDLELYLNRLTGSIPSSIGRLIMLQYLVLSSNDLTGSIPPSIGNLTTLLQLDVSNNRLIGSIPSSIGELTMLRYLFLYANDLTGSIPVSVAGCVELQYFDGSSNSLTSVIPKTLPSSLVIFIVADCFLTGMVFLLRADVCYRMCSLMQCPGDLNHLFSISSLASLSLAGNMISHLNIQQISATMQFLSLAGNRVAMSPAIDRLLHHPFVFLDLSDNRFNGSLPANVWNTTVQQLLLNNNRFSGTFPSLGDTMCSMQYVSVAGNDLWGSLPVDLQSCSELTSFFASDMQLTGSVSGLFATQPRLQVVVVSNNSFTGPLDDVFAASTASGLILNAAYNQFSGKLPVGSLQTGRYQSLILTSNCLTGTLPGDALCANGNLTELILSGLHSAASCRLDVFPTLDQLGVYSSYVETRAVGGTVPGCVFDSLPQLTYLALSGNALIGALPGEVSLPETLQGLDLSHNQLTGSIAAGIVAANLTLLDLSFNRLSGTISDQASDVYVRDSSSRVSLEVNELSGTLPRSWVEAVNITVLDGNLFACAVGRIGETANAPVNDPLQATYACGSSSTDVALVVTLVVGVAMGGVAGLVWMRWRSSEASVVWEAVVDECRRCLWPWRFEVVALGLYMMGSLVVYAVLTETTTVYAETYVWTVSLSLQKGVVAGCLVLVWLGLLVWAYTRRSQIKTIQLSLCTIRTITKVVLGGLVHVLPVFAVNMVYVYTTTLRLRGSLQIVVVLLMSLFKVTWNVLMNMFMTRDLHGMSRLLFFDDWEQLHASQLLLWCGLINLIIAPVVTEALISPNCFRFLFSQIPTNSYSIVGGTCYWIAYYTIMTDEPNQAIPCMSYAQLQQTYNNNVTTSDMVIISQTSNGEASTVDFQAGFAYNYQCSFSLLQAFVYVFIYKYIMSIVVLPLVWMVLKRVQMYSYARYGLSSVGYRWATLCLPPMMKLLDNVDAANQRVDTQAMDSNRARLAQWEKDHQAKKCSTWLRLRMSGDLAVALSFGLLFPLLGLLALAGIGADVLQTIWMVHKMRLQKDRFSCRASTSAGSASAMTHDQQSSSPLERISQLQLEEYHRVADQSMDAFEQVVPNSIRSLVADRFTVLRFAAVTWALTLYDIVGREEGSVRSVWILVVTVTMPWWMLALWQVPKYLWPPRGEGPSTDKGVKSNIEMTENPLNSEASKQTAV